jgi:tryptophan synthase alpha chain
MGVTGTRTSVSGNAKSLVERIRTQTNTPVSVGLGVSTKAQASEVAKYADGVIVGSAFIKQMQESSSIQEGLAKVESLAKELSEGVRR